MKQKSTLPLIRESLRCLIILTLMVSATQKMSARPYATSLTNAAGVVSFRLNEDADSVKIISSAGATTNDLGPILKGLTVTNLGISGNFKVQVTKAAGAGYLQGIVSQISVDTDNAVRFVNQRGVAVNKNPTSPYFGRVYVSVATAGTTAAPARTVSDGIYLLNADQTDAVGQGDTARTGGLVFDPAASAGSESPYRLFVGPDDNLYISDWSDSKGDLYVTDPNVATNSSATNVLADIGGPTSTTFNHGSVFASYTEGSLANGNLVVWTGDEDLSPGNTVWRYDIGSGPLPYAGSPTALFTAGFTSSQVAKVVRGPDGTWYKSQRRADNSTSVGIYAVSSDGSTILWDSLSAWRGYTGNSTAFDIYFSEMRGIAVTPDGKLLAGIKGNTNSINFLPLSGGVPNIGGLFVMPTTPTTSIGRDLTFDAAGNLYTVSSGQGVLRIYSPGGFSTVTSGSDGSFSIFIPSVDVSATATDSHALEGGADNGEFTISRVANDVSQPLTVRFQMSGTATNVVDYALQTNGVTLTTNAVIIPAGATTVTMSLVPVDDSISELAETATLTLTPSPNYNVPTPSATITIDDNDTPMIDITSVAATMFEQTTNDYVRFSLTRRGDLTAAITVNLTYGGSGVAGTDFVANSPVSIDAGIVTQTFDVHPIDDSLVEGNETVTVSVATGTGYLVGTNSPPTVTGTILDDDVPAETVLFSENFDTSDSATNWSLFFAATNSDQIDYTATFGYDYSGDLIPAAPHSGSDTHGLKLAVNDSIGSAAALNFYPLGKTFGGNFALRFDMFLILGNGSLTTEYALMGIDHSGTKTNWFRNSAGGVPAGWVFDGLFYGIESDAGALGDYVLYGPTNVNNNPIALTPGRNASTLTDTFKVPPYAAAGAPANKLGTTTPSWVQGEVSQIGNVVTLKLNNTTIFSYSNVTGQTNGNIMIGYCDGFDSIGPADAGVIFDNVRVVSLDGIKITKIQTSSGNAIVDFTFSLNDAASAFKLQSSANVAGTFTDSAATIVQLSPNTYRATIAQSGPLNFYRVRHL
jgi:hypothetical protein